MPETAPLRVRRPPPARARRSRQGGVGGAWVGVAVAAFWKLIKFGSITKIKWKLNQKNVSSSTLGQILNILHIFFLEKNRSEPNPCISIYCIFPYYLEINNGVSHISAATNPANQTLLWWTVFYVFGTVSQLTVLRVKKKQGMLSKIP